jgi:broad specificity phosphatase PhoE
MSTRLLLVRHGRTAYNAEVRFMGQLDIPMDEKEAQVRHFRRLATESRLSSTAASLCVPRHGRSDTGGHRLARRCCGAELTVGNFGDWQGKRYEDILVEDAERLANWEADRLGVAPPNGEALADIAEPVKAAYDDICSRTGPDGDHCCARGIAAGIDRAGTGPAARGLLESGRINASLSELRL